MRYWTPAAQDAYRHLVEGFDARTVGAAEFFDARIARAVELGSADMVCAVLRLSDEHGDDPPAIRFFAAIACMARKQYDLAYACWDDGGAVFADRRGDAVFPPDMQPSAVMRDLCGNMLELQRKLHEQSARAVDGELCDLLAKVL
jgi:hypothetical protein